MYGNNDHALTEHELNHTIYGWASAAAFAAWFHYWQLQIRSWVWIWGLLVGLVIPIVGYFIIANAGVDPNSPYGSPPEWVSTVVIGLGILDVCLIIAGLCCLWLDWSRQIAMRKAQYQQAVVQQQQAQYQAGADKVRYDFAVAQATGEAVAAAMMRQRPPEDPTGAPQRPTAPKPTPPAPMGSSTPTLWVPTYQGARRRELQRSETSLDGVWMNDYRGVDPDDL